MLEHSYIYSRFMNRIAAHAELRKDPDFRQFLEAEGVSGNFSTYFVYFECEFEC